LSIGAAATIGRIEPHGNITALLAQWTGGDDLALQQLMPLIQRELHRIAVFHMANERPGHTLQPTALVNETFVRLLEGQVIAFRDRVHFLSLCARVMRRILVDHARAHRAAKRGGSAQTIQLDEALGIPEVARADFAALDDALLALAKLDERKSRVVELRFFGGLTVEETAAAVEVSAETVMRDWQFAKSWLQREMRVAIG
jgi:RNA polymerase sigma factor (TIGR02999 family)